MDSRIIFVFSSFCVFLSAPETTPSPCFLPDLYAACDFKPNLLRPSSVSGYVRFSQYVDRTTCRYGDLNVDMIAENFPNTQGMSTSKHGLHVYEYGDLSRSCESLGPHFNPLGSTHGAPWMPSNRRHAGDFGNVRRRIDGTIRASFSDKLASLHGNGIIGRGIGITEYPDDLGLGGGSSLIDGNSGDRMACCVIDRLIIN